MVTTGQVFRVSNYSSGLNLKVAEEDAKPTDARIMTNWVIDDDTPDLKKREGSIVYKVQIPGGLPVKGLYRFYKTDGAKITVAIAGTNIWAIRDADDRWVKIGDGIVVDSNNPWSWVTWTLSDTLYFVNEDQGIAPRKLFKYTAPTTGPDLDASSVTTVATPNAFKWIIMHQEKLFALSAEDSSRVYFSAGILPEDYTNSQGIENFVGTDTPEGDKSLGMAVNSNGNLTIVKESSVWTLFGTNEQNYRLVRANTFIGGAGGATINNVENDILYLSRKGLYQVLSGTSVDDISEVVEPLFTQQLNGSLLKRSTAGYVRNNYHLAVARTGSSVNDLIVIYDNDRSSFYQWERLTGFDIRCMSVWVNEGNQGELYLGTGDGHVVKMYEGGSDFIPITVNISVIAVNNVTVDNVTKFTVNGSYNVYDLGGTYRKTVVVTSVSPGGFPNDIVVDDATGMLTTDTIVGIDTEDIECTWKSVTHNMDELERRKRFRAFWVSFKGNEGTLRVNWDVDNGERTGQLPFVSMVSGGALYGTAVYGTDVYSGVIPKQKSYGFVDGAVGQGIAIQFYEKSQLGTFSIRNHEIQFKRKTLHYEVNP